MAVGRRAAVGTKRVQPVAAPLDGDKAASAAVPVQLHRSAGGDGPGRVHPGRPAHRHADRGTPAGRRPGVAGLGGVRDGGAMAGPLACDPR